MKYQIIYKISLILLLITESFSIAIDESNHIKYVSQFAVFVRTVDNNFQINVELLKLIPIKDKQKVTYF